MVMKILYYVPSIDKTSGGIATFIQPLSRELGKLCELHIATHRTENMVSLDNCELHFLPSIPMSFIDFFRIRQSFYQLLRRLHPDLLHSNACWTPYSAYTVIWARKLGYKVVLTPHGMLEPWIMQRHYYTKKVLALLLYQKSAIKKANILLATAESERLNLQKLKWNDRIAVVPNCVSLEEITAKTNYVLKKNILYLGRIHEKKGIEMLVDALSTLRDKFSGWSVSIVGNGDEAYIQKLKNLSKTKGVDKIIKFYAPVFGQQKFNLYRNADLFVLPTYSENFGIVVAEALACGTPVLTTKGAPWEDLITYNCGWWCEPNTDSLTESLQNFISKPQGELEKMGRNGRQLVEERYSEEAVGKMMFTLYKWLCGDGEKPIFVNEL